MSGCFAAACQWHHCFSTFSRIWSMPQNFVCAYLKVSIWFLLSELFVPMVLGPSLQGGSILCSSSCRVALLQRGASTNVETWQDLLRRNSVVDMRSCWYPRNNMICIPKCMILMCTHEYLDMTWYVTHTQDWKWINEVIQRELNPNQM